MNTRMDDRKEINETPDWDEAVECGETALLDALVDGELPEEEAVRLREHLADCPACRAYLDDIRAIRAAFPTLEDTEVPEGFADRVLDSLPPRISVLRGGQRRNFWHRAALPLAASLALILTLRGVWLTGGPQSGGEVMTRTLPVAEEAVQDAEASGAAEAADVDGGKADGAENADESAGETDEAEGVDESAVETDGAEGAGESAVETDRAEGADESAVTETETTTEADAGIAPAAEADAGTPETSGNGETAGNGENTETKPASPKNTGDTGNSGNHTGNTGNSGNHTGNTGNSGNHTGNTGNSGKPSDSGTGGGKTQTAVETPSAPAVPPVPEPDVPAVPEPGVPAVPEPDVPAVPEPDVPAVPEPDVPAVPEPGVPPVPEPDVPAVPEPEDPKEGWIPREWESGSSSPVSGYEDLDGLVSLLGIEDGASESDGEGASYGADSPDTDPDTDSRDTDSAETDTDSQTEEETALPADGDMYLPPEAAPYLGAYSPTARTNSGVWYELTAAQFQTLADALEDTGLVDAALWAERAENARPGDTVFVFLRNAS